MFEQCLAFSRCVRYPKALSYNPNIWRVNKRVGILTFKWFISLFMCSNSLFSLFLSACSCSLFLSMIFTAITFLTSSASQPIFHTANAPLPNSFVKIMYFPIYFSLFSISYLLLITSILQLNAFDFLDTPKII